MSLGRTHRTFHGHQHSKARLTRIRDKANQLRQRVAKSTNAFMARHEARIEWWKQAFRAPWHDCQWIFAKARSLCAAFLSLLGLTVRSWPRSSRRRKVFFESLEDRRVLATLYMTGLDPGAQPFSKYDIPTDTWTTLGSVTTAGQLAVSTSGQLYMLNQTTNFII